MAPINKSLNRKSRFMTEKEEKKQQKKKMITVFCCCYELIYQKMVLFSLPFLSTLLISIRKLVGKSRKSNGKNIKPSFWLNCLSFSVHFFFAVLFSSMRKKKAAKDDGNKSLWLDDRIYGKLLAQIILFILASCEYVKALLLQSLKGVDRKRSRFKVTGIWS